MKFAVAILLLAVAYAQGQTSAMPPIMESTMMPGFGGGFIENHMVCHVGTIVMVEGAGVYFDNTTATVCPDVNSTCATFKIVSREGGVLSYTESGECVAMGQEKFYDCAAAQATTNVTFENCTVDFCAGFACNKFTAPKECKEAPKEDIQILPSCTLRETLKEVMTCVEPLYSGYPYKMQERCTSNLDKAISCLSKTTSRCLSGSCPTVLDDIPHLRAILRNVSGEAKKYTSIRELFEMAKLDTKYREMILGAICPVAGETPSFPEIDMSWMESIEIPFCDEGFLKKMTGLQMEMMKAFYSAESRADICISMMSYGIRMEKLWKDSCSVEMMREFLAKMLTGNYSKYVSVIMRAMEIMHDVFSKMEMPNCEFDMMKSPCDKFHESERVCDLRKAWLCDYVDWKLSFFKNWMSKVEEWQSNNIMMEMPDMGKEQKCELAWKDDLCTNRGTMRCVVGTKNCPMCYCTDHEYTDMGAVAKMWRKDYKMWHGIMKLYTHMTSGNQMCGM